AAMRGPQSKRPPKHGQSGAATHKRWPREDEPASVQPPVVGTAGTKQRRTERAEIGGDPYGNARTHQPGGPTNAKQNGLPKAKKPDTESDHTTRFDRITDVDDGEHQPEDRAKCARCEVTKFGCRERAGL